MKVVFSKHAVERLAERGVSRFEAEALLLPALKTGRYALSKNVTARPTYLVNGSVRGSMRLRVVFGFCPTSGVPVVVTVAWLN